MNDAISAVERFSNLWKNAKPNRKNLLLPALHKWEVASTVSSFFTGGWIAVYTAVDGMWTMLYAYVYFPYLVLPRLGAGAVTYQVLGFQVLPLVAWWILIVAPTAWIVARRTLRASRWLWATAFG